MEQGMIEIGSFYFKNATTEINASGPALLINRIALLVGAPNGAIRGESVWRYKQQSPKRKA